MEIDEMRVDDYLKLAKKDRLENLNNMANATECNFREVMMFALVSIAETLDDIQTSLSKKE